MKRDFISAYIGSVDPEHEGFKAGRSGIAAGLNPFTDDDDKCSQWKRGWERGHQERYLDSVRYAGL